ncbi:MAG: type II secretion system protein M [Nitrosomonadales bacterium]|nr:type II secretion system protein M [Nitrosomonadales bacterium]
MKTRWIGLKKRYWDGRAARERHIIALSALLLSPLIAWWLLWQPAHTASLKLRAGIPVLRVQAEQMRAQVAEAAQLHHRPRPATLDAGALKLAIEASAERHHLRGAVTTLDTIEPRSVRITLASVSFEQWLRWLRDLQREQHIRADSLGIAALPQTGMVKVSATLTNGGAQ